MKKMIVLVAFLFGIGMTSFAQIGCFPQVNQCAPRVWPWPMGQVCNPPVMVNTVWVNPNPVYIPSYSYQWVRRPALDGNGNVIYNSRGRIVYEWVRILVQH